MASRNGTWALRGIEVSAWLGFIQAVPGQPVQRPDPSKEEPGSAEVTDHSAAPQGGLVRMSNRVMNLAH
ncbi:hypothetical protein ABTO87_18410, partial [Acinetobacter baumannii]